MTTVSRERFKCAVCGEQSEQYVLTSTNMFGSPDLDTRPPEMARSNLSMEAQRCPRCGYCAPCLDEDEYGSADLIGGEEYREQLGRQDYPELANTFLCCALISEGAGEYADAGWQAMRAAWVCDDSGNGAAAAGCRGRTYELFVRATGKGLSFMQEPGGEEAVMTDLLRRSGRLAEALELCERSLESGISGIAAEVLHFEKALIEKEDTTAHTVAEALPELDD